MECSAGKVKLAPVDNQEGFFLVGVPAKLKRCQVEPLTLNQPDLKTTESSTDKTMTAFNGNN